MSECVEDKLLKVTETRFRTQTPKSRQTACRKLSKVHYAILRGKHLAVLITEVCQKLAPQTLLTQPINKTPLS